MQSIISYPDRGKWGDAKYRGNTSGHVIKDLLLAFKPKKFLEVFAGGGTGKEVAVELGYKDSIHLDLNPKWGGWNALVDEIPEGADFVFSHPPYHSMITYSGNQWGAAHPDDLSRSSSYEEFIEKLDLVNAKIYASLLNGGRHAILIGDMRKNKQYYPMFRDMTWFGRLESLIIKQQHNVMSNNTSYSGSFIPIMHEYVLVFKKDTVWAVPIRRTVMETQDLRQMKVTTWRDLVQGALQALGGEATLREIYAAVKDSAQERLERKANNHVEEKIRQTLQRGREFESLERGTWRLAPAAA